MKKLASGLLALVLTAAVCAGCVQKNPPSGIFYDVTGIDPESTAVTVGDVKIPAEMYLYWTAYACSSMEYNLNMYRSYYGLYEEMFSEDGAVLWDADFMEGSTLAGQVKEQVDGSVRFYAAIESKAKELGVTLAEEDRAELDASFAETVEQLGGEEAFQQNLELMGISKESFDRISEDACLFDKLLSQVTEEGGALYMAPEDYEQYAAYTDHILLMTKDQETNEDLSEEEVSQKYATAQDLLSQLQNAGEDELEDLFNELADGYSEDPGRAASNGYVVTEDTNFVQEFLDAALALEPGQVSGIVESDYGYHILYRRNLAGMLEQSPDQLSALAEEHLYGLLEDMEETFEVKTSKEISELNIGEFYTAYNAKVEEISAAREAENSAADGTDGAAAEADGDGADGGSGADSSGADGGSGADSSGADGSGTAADGAGE